MALGPPKMNLNVLDCPEGGATLEWALEPEEMAALLEAEGGQAAPEILSPCEIKLSAQVLSGRLKLAGVLQTKMAAQCDRCLEPVEMALVQRVDETLLLNKSGARFDEAAEDGEDDEALRVDAAGQVDLAPLVCEFFWLAWPFQVLCSENCKGLCPRCGGDLNKGGCVCKK